VNPLRPTPTASTALSWQDRLYAVSSRTRATVAEAPKPTVLVGAAPAAADPTYASALGATVDPSSDDAIAARLQRNVAASDTQGLFAGLGQALLGRFTTDGADFVADVPGTGQLDASVQLGIRTASGATVKLSLTGTDSGLSVRLTSDRPLADGERDAVAGLAGAFQAVVDGLAKVPPVLSLDGLLAADPSVLSSIDLNASVATASGAHQVVALHAGADARSLKVDGPTGNIALNLDMSQPATWGNRTQRDASVENYLAQVDAASRRGHADASLVALFKDGFSQLNSHYPPGPSAMATRGTTHDFSRGDHALLTGLADFNASIAQTATAPNPRHGDELDTFQFDVTQSTAVTGRNALDRHITQARDSHLTASFHTSPWPDSPLNLTTDPASQNYNYTQIDDSAHSATEIAYAKGKLVTASLSQEASQSTRVRQYMMAQLIDDTTAPSHRQATRDLLPLLTPSGASADALHAAIQLQADPARLNT
jgi:hypothetical protein